MNMVKAGNKLGFHDTCPRSEGVYGTWSPAVSFVLADGNENPFLIWLKLKHWWVSGLGILASVVLKQKEGYFCVMSTWKGIESFSS